MSSVYQINKGINKPIEFKGLKAQYIWYLGAGAIGLLIFFGIMYVIGINTFLCLAIIAIAGTALFMHIYKLSHRYGQHGMMKAIAKRSVPRLVKCTTRKVFVHLNRESE